MDIAKFRNDFPEFADPTKYSDTQVALWLSVAGHLVNAERWGPLMDLALGLVAAHHLVLGARDVQAAEVGGVPGQMTGPQSSKSVDKVSASYDTGAATIDGAGFWNLTSYGVRFVTLSKSIGAGPLQF